jgi:hypothetical protein
MAIQKFSLSGITSGVKYRNFRTNFPATQGPFSGNNQSVSDLRTLMANMINYDEIIPTAGGSLTINGVSLSSYDYTIKRNKQLVNSFNSSEWFTDSVDTRPALIAIDGDLEITSDQTFIPSVRKLFTCIYINGDLTLNGTVSMSRRGSNHSGTGTSGGYVAPGNVMLATGTYSSISNPYIPSSGGAGGSSSGDSGGSSYPGNVGGNGTSGGTGGGGAGYKTSGPSFTGAGTAGTSFTGGTGGGGGHGANGSAGTTNGGKGGNAGVGPYGSDGGAGNPGGNQNNGSPSNRDGTGGVLVIYVSGTIFGSGLATVEGAVGSGGSGGGSLTIFYKTDSSTITLNAAGGSSSGGTGTARKLQIP